MALYQYIKFPPKRPMRRPWFISLGLMSAGLFILAWAIWPIISFSLLSDTLFARVITPVPDGRIAAKSPAALAPVALAAGDNSTGADLTNANAWFPTSPQKKIVAPVNTYTLSIPKLKITNATVTIASDDLAKSLIHYGGTALPGAYGTTVIIGHSTLPQFFNPTNYKTIFSTLPTLSVGDDILVMYDGVKYRYTVYEMVVVEPTDLSVLEQRFDDSYLTLVTCVPPGTYWKRLNVKARLARL